MIDKDIDLLNNFSSVMKENEKINIEVLSLSISNFWQPTTSENGARKEK